MLHVFFIFFCFISLGACKTQKAYDASAKAVLANAADQDKDLPPAGTRSLFDALIFLPAIADSDARREALLKDFPKLTKAFDAFVHGDGMRILFPMSRSLQAFVPEDKFFEKPRQLYTLIGPATNSGLACNGQLFMGHRKGSDEIEVISYNEGAGRYEFQVVMGVESGTPTIQYAARQACITCHQDGGPLLPVNTWDDSNINKSVASLIRFATTQEVHEGAEAVQVPFSDSADFDNMVRAGSSLLFNQWVWQHGCDVAEKKDTTCRALLMFVSLYWLGAIDKDELVNEQNRTRPAQGAIAQAEALLSTLLTTGVNHNMPAEGILPTSKLTASGLNKALSKRIDEVSQNPTKESLSQLEHDLAAYRLAPLDDPKTARKNEFQASSITNLFQSRIAMAAGMPEIGESFFRIEDIDLIRKAINAYFTKSKNAEQLGSVNRLETSYKLFLKMSEQQHGVFGPGPFRRRTMVNTILNAFDQPSTENCCEKLENLPKPLLASNFKAERINAFGGDHRYMALEYYCGRCHGIATNKAPFLAGKDKNAIIKELLTWRDDILEVLKSKGVGLVQMPPRSVANDLLKEFQADNEGRTEIVNFVSTLDK